MAARARRAGGRFRLGNHRANLNNRTTFSWCCSFAMAKRRLLSSNLGQIADIAALRFRAQQATLHCIGASRRRKKGLRISAKRNLIDVP